MRDLLRAKKMAAAVAAVLQYAAEQEALVGAVASPALGAPAAGPVAGPAPFWGLAGRQDAMLYRSLWQRRLSRSW
ncbi:MAG: hypothetical protein ACYDA8_00335 [Deferrisomatales bacterium]